ncbi:uncharacterized protein LOC6584777 [Drosophila mojavensis]|uniref:Uncharacterized protein, isoform A n=1 Tax=Drosophila mojavensis TaxID=7230 RepID=B4L215_DROMO|nr:uncharacterized protein LOC6584777 [Drosophila mojavensis]XP_015016719.1 uncharacterized protein LOC6584777 [Drosophila mojavensis]EDW07736.1 uncharacterized protein Dmoj_GI14692, isoform A [Drosophila mojavensis]KRF94184.1 uncharacterized protein Dmoj_GI14692, isoform B [Drosophila mojavensis]
MPTPTWEASRIIKKSNKSSIFPDDGRRRPQTFVPPSERRAERTQMSLLLGWEYGREWLAARDEARRHDSIRSPQRFIEPDYNWWLKKRTTTLDRRKLYTRSRTPQTKTYMLSAFETSRTQRQDQKQLQLLPEPGTTHDIQCECANCKQSQCRTASKDQTPAPAPGNARQI